MKKKYSVEANGVIEHGKSRVLSITQEIDESLNNGEVTLEELQKCGRDPSAPILDDNGNEI